VVLGEKLAKEYLEVEYKCKLCGEKFNAKENAIQHILKKHVKRCSTCKHQSYEINARTVLQYCKKRKEFLNRIARIYGNLGYIVIDCEYYEPREKHES